MTQCCIKPGRKRVPDLKRAGGNLHALFGADARVCAQRRGERVPTRCGEHVPRQGTHRPSAASRLPTQHCACFKVSRRVEHTPSSLARSKHNRRPLHSNAHCTHAQAVEYVDAARRHASVAYDSAAASAAAQRAAELGARVRGKIGEQLRALRAHGDGADGGDGGGGGQGRAEAGAAAGDDAAAVHAAAERV
eukprot:522799-Pleurochrysis_carterae.AAC.2